MDIATFPAGRYVIGDLCYRDQDDWDQMIDSIDGKVHKLSDGRQYVIMNTAYGDGSYLDQYGNEYWVDSGTIGIMQYDGKLDSRMGRTFDFDGPFQIYKENGKLIFGSIIIDTDPVYEDDEDDGQPDEIQEWHDYDPDC
jgi:hypothetical protein